jgi:hypothetical protein
VESEPYLGHSTINHELSRVDEAALIAGEEYYRLSLFNGFTESSGWEMDLTTVTLRYIIAEPVLEERSAKMKISK